VTLYDNELARNQTCRRDYGYRNSKIKKMRAVSIRSQWRKVWTKSDKGVIINHAIYNHRPKRVISSIGCIETEGRDRAFGPYFYVTGERVLNKSEADSGHTQLERDNFDESKICEILWGPWDSRTRTQRCFLELGGFLELGECLLI